MVVCTWWPQIQSQHPIYINSTTGRQTGCESSQRVRMWMMACTMLSQSLWMKLSGPLSLEMVSVNWLSSTRQTCQFTYSNTESLISSSITRYGAVRFSVNLETIFPVNQSTGANTSFKSHQTVTTLQQKLVLHGLWGSADLKMPTHAHFFPRVNWTPFRRALKSHLFNNAFT